MKKDLLLHYLLLFVFLLSSCSDDKNDPNTEPPGPPDEEYVDGINTFPETLTASEEGRIVFKASQTSPLHSSKYTGDVYAHIGIVTGDTWDFVPADWGVNTDKCKMTKVEDNVWSLSLKPNIRSWFGAPEMLSIQKIGVVFRSTDGKTQEKDLFITVEDTSIKPIEIEHKPQPTGTIEGINIIDPSTVTLVLYDKDTNGKYKDAVYLIGDFNEWTIDTQYLMKRDDDTGCWWYTVTGLNGQTEYAFQYFVVSKTDGNIRLADPYTEKVLDPQDVHISSSTYPGLRKYSSDKTTDIISTFITQPQAYNWQVNNFRIEDEDNLIIYEMLFRDFTDSGDINGALEKLDYLETLGVNAIELMPIQEFDGNDSWGYNPCFFFAMDKAYGTKEMYKKFVDECHKRGIAVILDVVYNHATGANPFAKLYWNSSASKTVVNNPWFNVDAPHPYSVFHDFNHESPLVKKFVKRNLLFLLEEYKIDGFRFDLTKGFTQKQSTESTAGNYDPSRVAILKEYNKAIKDAYPDAYVIFEHFAVLQEEKELADAGIHLWRNANNAYCQSAMGYPENSSFGSLYTGNSISFGSWVGYMESHDEERTSYKAKTWGDGTIATNLGDRMKQAQVNAAFFFTVPGPKMVWQFGELGYDISIDENGRTGKKPILWNYYDIKERKALYDTYSQLIKFRTSYPELFTENADFSWQVNVSNWANGRFIKASSGNKAMVVAGNFTNGSSEYTVEFPNTGAWYDYINNSTINVTTGKQIVAIPANEFRLFVNFNPK